jgi:hypothetical protein
MYDASIIIHELLVIGLCDAKEKPHIFRMI